MRELLFASVVLVMAFLIYVYPASILSHLLFETSLIGPVSAFATIASAVLVLGYLRTHATSRLLGAFTFYGMGAGFIGFCIFNIALLLSLVIPQSSFAIAVIGFVIFALAVMRSLYSGRAIVIKRLVIETSKLQEAVKIIFISDVHLGSNSHHHLKNICSLTADLDYDHLLIGGDLFDSSAFEPQSLTPLKTIKKPIHFVTGNHEYYVKNYEAKVATLSDYNIITLDNECAEFGDLNIIGISDNQAPNIQADMAQKLISDDKFNLLMVHQPAIWGRTPSQTDLMLSGHTHSGQIFPFHYLVRLQFKAVYGLYQHMNSWLYVSSGSGTWGPKMRLGTQNEIVHITLTPKSDKS